MPEQIPLELIIAFDDLPPDTPDDAPIGFALDCRPIQCSYRGAFVNPIDDKARGEIRWYLEEYYRWPTEIDQLRAREIEANQERWGRVLFDALFDDREAGRHFERFVSDAAGEKRIIIEAKAPQVQRLPWELLAVDSGPLFARRRNPVSLYRRVRLETTPAIEAFAQPQRVLLITALPEEAGFIDPRSIARGMLDALDPLIQQGQVTVDFLRPPTLAALDAALTRAYEAGRPYHIVHFDGHGVYQKHSGLGQLAFERDDFSLDLVDANRLGLLLQECGVPLMVLNACQSAQGDQSNPFSSVATRLLEAGGGGVLSMSHSVLVVTASRFVAAFYAALVEGRTIARAADAARRGLVQDSRRFEFERLGRMQAVELHDWFLPVLYQQQGDRAPFTSENLSGFPKPDRSEPQGPAALPDPPQHGFVGRARELLALERAFHDHGIVVLHGFGGLGKTALAAEAGRWFTRTGRFPGGAAFVSFEGGGSLLQLCSWVGQALSGDPDFMIHGEGDPVTRIAALLREQPALIILDNFESVLGREPLMPAEELRAVLDAALAWAAAPGSAVLITTRDTTFDDPRFAPSRRCAHLALQGLALSDALDLAAAVLRDHSIPRERAPREELLALLDRLGGHPLSLALVLPRLQEHTLAELTARFEELLPGFTAGAAKERNESLALSLEFSLRRLSEAARAELPKLALFQGGCMEYDLLAITEIDPALWQTARAELEAAALVTVEHLPGIQPPFLRFHPTLLPYLASHSPNADEPLTAHSERLTAHDELLTTRYWQRYYALANYLYKTDTQHPHEARAIALRELPNLRRALDLALAAGALDAAVVFAACIAQFLDAFGRWREREGMMTKVESYGLRVASSEGLTKAEFLLATRRGEALLQQGRAREAEAVFRELLGQLEAGAAYDAEHDRGLAFRNIGLAVAAQGKPGEAIGWHERAASVFAEISKSENLKISESAKKMLAVVQTDVANNLAEVGQFDRAEKQYQIAVQTAQQSGNQRQVGVALAQVGNLALMRGALGEARERYMAALETFRALGEPQSEAVIWHQLGMVAEEAKAWDEAERCYREAVRIFEQIRDLPKLAGSFNQLAMVAEGAGRLADAERWYLRAIALGEELHYNAELGKWLSNLADLYLAQGRLAEAESYARRAVAIMETLDLSAEPWKTYGILARIAEAQGRPAEARAWRRKEQESYAAYAGASHQMQRFQPFIVAAVRATQGDAEALAFLEGEYPKMQAGDWGNVPPVLRRILAGERDADALTENLSRTPALMVHAILAGLDAPSPNVPTNARMGAAPSSDVAAKSISRPPEPPQQKDLGDHIRRIFKRNK